MPQELEGTSSIIEDRSPFREEDWERVGETLKTFRENRGLTPDQLAKLLGVSRPYWANIEAGRKRLTNVLHARAAEALGVTQMSIMRPDLQPAEREQ